MKQRVGYWSERIYWFFNSKFHRDKGLPAIYYFEDRKLFAVYYYQHGKYHRTTGPACVNYRDKIKQYFYQNRKYTSLEEIKMLEACK